MYSDYPHQSQANILEQQSNSDIKSTFMVQSQPKANNVLTPDLLNILNYSVEDCNPAKAKANQDLRIKSFDDYQHELVGQPTFTRFTTKNLNNSLHTRV